MSGNIDLLGPSTNKIKKNMFEKNKKYEYTIVDYPEENRTMGRFHGSSPKQAAKKAFSKLARISKLNNTKRQFIVFIIKNLTTNKEYKYIGSRIKLENPKKVVINGKNIIYRYINVIGKYKEELNKIK